MFAFILFCLITLTGMIVQDLDVAEGCRSSLMRKESVYCIPISMDFASEGGDRSFNGGDFRRGWRIMIANATMMSQNEIMREELSLNSIIWLDLPEGVRVSQVCDNSTSHWSF